MTKFLLVALMTLGLTEFASAAHRLPPSIAQLLKPQRAATFTCDNTIYVSSHPYGNQTTDLLTLAPYTGRSQQISRNEAYGYDAIGFNHTDGYLYGISNYGNLGDDNPHLIRINPANGDILDLGPNPALDGEEWIIGTIMKDGTYVIGTFATMKWLRIDLTNYAIVDSGTLPRPFVTAWAANPIDNMVYGYETMDQKLIRFNPYTNVFEEFPNELTNVGQYPCSTAFYQDGTMFLYCKDGDTTNSMYRVDLLTHTAVSLTSGLGLGAGDMATCAFPNVEPTPVPEPEPDPDFSGKWQNHKHCIEIAKDLKSVEYYDKCGPLECKKRRGILKTYSFDGSENTNERGLITYNNRLLKEKMQEVHLLDSRRMRVMDFESVSARYPLNDWDRDVYHKVRECKWKMPHIPIPHPKPKPKPKPQPTPTPG
ncbi:DUF6923 family protein [Bdellovibrio sp. HCB274]|uniref:DUF6923 family protein n=1 Tax=Bdellovibrio sp. HCB274 TaxID=3394361 RepID=UPI0039B42362